MIMEVLTALYAGLQGGYTIAVSADATVTAAAVTGSVMLVV